MSIREIATDQQKKILRKHKLISELSDIARNILVQGVLERGMYIQFGSDLRLYNLWEALLYAEGYENRGAYVKGSVLKTFNAVCQKISLVH